jgi:glycosyltransferase involved in cell wall biosynthesis
MGEQSPDVTNRGKRAAVVTAFDPERFHGGIERFTLNLVDLLSSHGWGCEILHAERLEPTPGFRSEFLGRIHALGLCAAARRFDLVVCNNFYGLSYFPPDGRTVNVFHATHAGFAESVRGIVDRRMYLEWRMLWGDLGDRVSGLGRKLVAVSEPVRDELDAYYGLSGATVVEHGVDDGLFAPEDRAAARHALGMDRDRRTGLFVGRWDVTKGSDVVAAVIQARPDIEWLVVSGTGERAESIAGLPGVRLFHEVDQGELPRLYSAADFLLFPSRYEGFGLVILEAMACGLPVIAAPVGVARAVFRDARLAQLALPAPDAPAVEQVAGCLERIRMLEERPELGSELGRLGRELVLGSYTHRHWRERMAQALELGNG